jgi:DNA-directed RNA polymerase specialized sigma24 family protein
MNAADTSDERAHFGTAVAGEPFEAWYRSQYPHVVRVLAVVGGDVDVACDAAAEAFTRALAQWSRVSAMESPSGWAYTVALNVLRRRQRRARLERLLAQRPPAPPPVPGDHLYLWDAVRSLPPRQRTAIMLHYAGDLPQAEVAKIMGIAPGTVAATLHAARGKLRSLLDDRDTDGTDQA